MRAKDKKIIFLIAVLLAVSFLIYWLGTAIKGEDIADFIEETGFWAPVVFIILTAFTYIVAPISGIPLWFAGYLLFGSKFQIYTYLAAILGATANFWIARRWGRRWVTRLVGAKNMEKVDGFAVEHGIKSLILLRFFAGSFHDFISYAYGLTNIKFTPYILISALGGIPWLLLWQLYLFKMIDDFQDFAVWSGITFIPLIIVSAIFLKKIMKPR